MTFEEILKLEPGPELNRLIAERVMGWRLVDGGLWVDKQNELRAVTFQFVPSTDIAAAMEALLHVMEAHGYDVMIESVSYMETATKANGITWVVILDPFDRARDQVKAESSHSLPLAICHALLLAMEGADG